MSEQNDFFDDVISDEMETDSSELPFDDDEGDIEAEEGPVDVRTVLMAKEEMIALIGMKTSEQGGLIVRIDPREARPAAQTYDDPAAASLWFNRSLKSSRRNGWTVIYDGEPLLG